MLWVTATCTLYLVPTIRTFFGDNPNFDLIRFFLLFCQFWNRVGARDYTLFIGTYQTNYSEIEALNFTHEKWHLLLTPGIYEEYGETETG